MSKRRSSEHQSDYSQKAKLRLRDRTYSLGRRTRKLRVTRSVEVDRNENGKWPNGRHRGQAVRSSLFAIWPNEPSTFPQPGHLATQDNAVEQPLLEFQSSRRGNGTLLTLAALANKETNLTPDPSLTSVCLVALGEACRFKEQQVVEMPA